MGGGTTLRYSRYSYCRTEYPIICAKKTAGNSVILIKISIKDYKKQIKKYSDFISNGTLGANIRKRIYGPESP